MATILKPGSKAPAFSLEGDNGCTFSLSDFLGKKVVLYFYPKDDTPGCTKQAIAFSADKTKFSRAGAVIIGISKDNIARHQKFKKKYDLKIALGSDENGKILQKYGVWVEKNMYGRKFMGIERTTFLIDEQGVIREIWRKVKVNGHAEEVLEKVKSL